MTNSSQYSNLDLTARSLLGFYTPSGSRITLSSFVRPKFGTSYSIGIKDGWISYLYSSLPLVPPTTTTTEKGTATTTTTKGLQQDDDDGESDDDGGGRCHYAPYYHTSSDRIPLPDLLRGYRPLSARAIRHAVGHSLVYGRMYLPQSRLEALVASRLTREIHLTVRAVSSQQGDLYRPHGGATVLGLAAWDDPAGRFGIETLASTDGGVLGLRGLWNASNPPADETPNQVVAAAAGGLVDINNNTNNANTTRSQQQQAPATTTTTISSAGITTAAVSDPAGNNIDKERINGRFSAGGEIYYGLLNKSGGVSLGGRFQTLPTHHGTPLTATLTFNLLGHIRATYAVVAGDCTLASCFGFNLYSYESEWAVGIELWNRRRRSSRSGSSSGGGSETVEAEPMVVDDTITTTPLTDASLVTGENMAFTTPVDEKEGPVVVDTDQVKSSDIAAAAATTTTPTTSSPPPPQKRVYKERSFQAKLEWRLDDGDGDGEEANDEPVTAAGTTTEEKRTEDNFPAGVLKARCDQNMRIGLLYEGRYKALLFSLGTDVDFRQSDGPFRTVGLAVQYSS